MEDTTTLRHLALSTREQTLPEEHPIQTRSRHFRQLADLGQARFTSQSNRGFLVGSRGLQGMAPCPPPLCTYLITHTTFCALSVLPIRPLNTPQWQIGQGEQRKPYWTAQLPRVLLRLGRYSLV